MAGHVNCVRVEPPFINFNDVRVGQVYKTSVTATNVGKTSKKIVIERPTLKVSNTVCEMQRWMLKL